MRAIITLGLLGVKTSVLRGETEGLACFYIREISAQQFRKDRFSLQIVIAYETMRNSPMSPLLCCSLKEFDFYVYM